VDIIHKIRWLIDLTKYAFKEQKIGEMSTKRINKDKFLEGE